MRKFIFFVLSLSLIGISGAWAETPSIIGVSGTLQTGHTLTISGDNLLDEDTSNWLMTQSQSRCEGANPLADGWTESRGSYSTDAYLTGTKSFRFGITGTGAGNCPYDNVMCSAYRSINKDIVYTRFYVRYSANCEDLFDTAIYAKMNIIFQHVYIQPVSGGGWPTSMHVALLPEVDTTYPLPEQWEGNHWYCVETKSNKLTKEVEVWVDNESIGSFTASTANQNSVWQIGFINACPVPADTFYMYADSLTVSTSRVHPIAIVEIGNSSDYATAAKVKQKLLHAADDTVEITCDLTGLGGGPYYIWVKNNRQERSPGFLLKENDVVQLLSENWEAGNFNNFDDDITLGQFAVQSNVVRSGSKALVNFLKAGVHDTGWMTGFFADNPYKGGEKVEDITLTWSIYWSPGFKFPLGQKMFILASFESWTAGYPQPLSYSPFYLSIGAENGQYSLQLHRKTSGDVWQDLYQNQGIPLLAQPGAWADFRLRLKLNTPGLSDGIAEMWINDVLKLSYGNVNFRDAYMNYGWNMLMITASATPNSTQNQSMYWDDIELFTGMPNELPPKSPTGLKLID